MGSAIPSSGIAKMDTWIEEAPVSTNDDRRWHVSRRAFLLIGGTTLAAAGVGGTVGVKLARDDLRPTFDPDGAIGVLGTREMATILALLETLVPADYLNSRQRSTAIINDATREEPGVLTAYQSGAVLLDRAVTDGRFGALSLAERDRVLDDILWRFDAETGGDFESMLSKAARRIERAAHTEEERRFRQLVVRDLLARFFRHAPGKIVGYSNHQGVPGDPRGYTRAPE